MSYLCWCTRYHYDSASQYSYSRWYSYWVCVVSISLFAHCRRTPPDALSQDDQTNSNHTPTASWEEFFVWTTLLYTHAYHDDTPVYHGHRYPTRVSLDRFLYFQFCFCEARDSGHLLRTNIEYLEHHTHTIMATVGHICPTSSPTRYRQLSRCYSGTLCCWSYRHRGRAESLRSQKK